MREARLSFSMLMLFAPSPANAANDLGIAMDSVPKALTEAAARIGVSIDPMSFAYTCAVSNCHLDAGSAVDVMAGRIRGPTAYTMEVSWNNGERDSSSTSRMLFHAMCATMVAAVEPTWSQQRVEAMVTQLALLRQSKEDQDFEMAVPGLVFYGRRAVPTKRDFRAEAFVTCGVRADLKM